MAEHTPGPWRGFVSEGVHGRKVWIEPAVTEHTHIAEVLPGVGCLSGYATAEANANLIAAAPDLLEACRGLREWARGVLTMGKRVIKALPGDFGPQALDDLEAQFEAANTAIGKAEEG